MTYTPVLIAHICGGIIGLVSGFVALFARKGGRVHRRSGDAFVLSMMCMAAGGAYVALTKDQPTNVLAGIFTFYLVATGLLTVIRTKAITSRFEPFLLLIALATGGSALFAGWQATVRPRPVGGAPATVYFVFATLLLLCAAGDVRMWIRGGLPRAQRLARHLWRMCFALLIAAVSFFMGTANDPVLSRTGLRARLFTKAVRATHLPAVPVILVLLLTIFWLCRVLFTSAYKKAEPTTI